MLPGSPVLIGSYRIERRLGSGSFATVWLGYDESLGARVAIKVLADNWSHDLRVRERFRDEGRLLWRLDHDRVIRVHAVGDLPDGRPYLVMAWADGGSLRDRLAVGNVTVGAGLHLLRQIAAGVAVLHREGVVHRDLTPGNILFRSGRAGSPSGRGDEQVVIADLGLAKALAAASGLTARAGTPGYMAPEQDDPLAIVDTRTDVYGLGRLGIRLLCVPAVRSRDAQLRPGVPPRIGDVLRTATAHRATDRYRDATAFGAALDRAMLPAGPWVRRRRRAMAVASAVVTTVAAMALAADSAASRTPSVALAPIPTTAAPSPAGPTPGRAAPSTPTTSIAVPPAEPNPGTGPGPVATSGGSATPTATPTATSTSGPTCIGPEGYDVDLRTTELESLGPLCSAVGGVLRLQGSGPGLVTVEPQSLASTQYDADVVDVHFLRPGTATVTIPKDQRVHTVTVEIIE